MTREQLSEKIAKIKAELEHLEKMLHDMHISEEKKIKEKIKRCLQMKYKFTPDELLFAAYAKCSCGCGLAYPKDIGMHGSWYCSSILLGEAEKGSSHDSPASFAFTFYEIKSEAQPSANGATTRKECHLKSNQ